MRNSVLHLVTNRNDGFASAVFPASEEYTPHSETDLEAEIRTFLQFDRKDTDYFILGPIMAVYAFPDILQEFKEDIRTFNFSDIRHPDDQTGGCALVGTQRAPLFIHRVPAEWPVQMDWKISYVDGRTLKITLGTVYKQLVKYRKSGVYLYVDWPSELGINAAIELPSETWASGSEVFIHHTPVEYPYALVVDKLTKKNAVTHLLTTRGLMAHFYAAQSAIEKMAVITLAFSNPQAYVS